MKVRKKKKKKHVPVRLNLLFFAVFVMFSALILRLGIVQIVYGDDYKREIERTEDVTVSNSVPRGKIYDRNGKIIVDNQPLYAITYTRTQKTSSKEMLETAEKLSKLIEVDTDKVRERDMKDFWILNNPEAAKKKVTEKEYQQLSDGKLTDDDIYKLQLERITEKEIDYSQSELEVLAIYSKFIAGYYLTPQIVKNKGTTYEEVARVNEQIESLPGVDTTTDWERKYAYGDTLKSVLGKVSSASEGLPSDKTSYYLARGYSRNDRVGTSYLEQQYEDLLRGQQEKIRNVTNTSGDIVSTEVISEGQRGKDLVLTVDMDLQIATEEIIEKQLKEKKASGNTKYLDRAFVVVTNPNTGELLTLAGKQYAADDNGKMQMNDMALGTFTSSYAMGSSVKGATILTGYQTGAIKPGQVIYDGPMKIKATPIKKSWKNFGNISDIEALKVSSNVYMFKTAIALGKGNYVPGGSLKVNNSAFSTMRNYYSQFGLGVKTGIDLPGEQIGYKGSSQGAGLLMDFSIGQYDTYTPLQLAQYVSTIANGGNRIKPHVLKQVREPVDDDEDNTLGPVIKEVKTEVMNTLPMKTEWIERVQEGFRQVTQSTGGTAYSYFGNADYKPAGKTGTAEAFYDGPKWEKGTVQPETYNITFVTYAPADNPEIAMSVVVPWAYQNSSGHKMNLEIAKEVYEKYYELKEERAKQK
ncbi:MULTISPECIES: penicillin-binding protein 2 [Bacillaceae]|uniref:peptidoglycan D,D-transpeptidase FtsI family protein n=1 Tax=Bacillaceae TaxID=186817 RepID=UPI000AB61EC7|nr:MULTISPECIES: penicillin-binding protein 2 [Bacillaceae]